jgi:alkaline phosphatase
MSTPRPLADVHPDHLFPTVDRRTLLKSTAIAAALFGLGAHPRALARAADETAPPQPPSSARAKNIIFMVSDGMSAGTLTLADMWTRKHRGAPSHWMNLWSRPNTRRAFARTHSLDSLVTDSAAGGSAWGCGVHINNGCVNVLPDGSQLMPILIHARQAGKATGVVTTARITHATPASFYANAARRDYEAMIGGQLLERGVDVALGGGARWVPESETSKHPEVQVVKTAAALRAAKPDGRLVGVFDPEHIPFVLDRDDTIPSLPEMSRIALDRLAQKPEGFVLQIEGGRIDHAAHNNDAFSLVREQVEFDETIGAVLDWAKDRNDTLIILTSDHGNANPGLTLYGEHGNRMFDRLAAATHSFDWIAAQAHGTKPASAWVEKIAAATKAATGADLDPDTRRFLTDHRESRRGSAFAEANKWPSILGAALADHCGIAFASPNHTADYVEVTALGPGSESIGGSSSGGGGIIDNTDLHGVMVAALSLADAKPLPDMLNPVPMPKPPKPD